LQRLALEEGISFQDFRKYWAEIEAERINLVTQLERTIRKGGAIATARPCSHICILETELIVSN